MLISIDGWRTGITFSASHFIPGHEKCERLHGHTFAIHVEIEGEKGPTGMVMDFVPLKRALKRISKDFDHKVLVAARSKTLSMESGKVICKSGGKEFAFPKDQTVVLDSEFSTAEEIAEHVMSRLVQHIDFLANVREVAIGIDEGGGQVAWTRRKLHRSSVGPGL